MKIVLIILFCLLLLVVLLAVFMFVLVCLFRFRFRVDRTVLGCAYGLRFGYRVSGLDSRDVWVLILNFRDREFLSRRDSVRGRF